MARKDEQPGSEHALGDLSKLFSKRITRVALLAIFILCIGQAMNNYLPSDFFILVIIVSTIGGTLLTACALGFILSDKDYVYLLRQHVVDVLFNPENYRDDRELANRWHAITVRLLAGVLPFSKDEAAHEIEEKFLISEKDFHFEEVNVKMDIEVSVDGKTAEIRQEFTSRLVISPTCTKPVLAQYITVEDSGESELVCIEINGRRINEACLEPQPSSVNENSKVLRFPINESLILRSAADERYVTYKRIYMLKQNLEIEPFVAANIERYVKGLAVQAKVSEGYRLYFKRFGIRGSASPKPMEVDDGYLKWIFAEHGQLLLPGESYILMILKNHNN